MNVAPPLECALIDCPAPYFRFIVIDEDWHMQSAYSINAVCHQHGIFGFAYFIASDWTWH